MESTVMQSNDNFNFFDVEKQQTTESKPEMTTEWIKRNPKMTLLGFLITVLGIGLFIFGIVIITKKGSKSQQNPPTQSGIKSTLNGLEKMAKATVGDEMAKEYAVSAGEAVGEMAAKTGMRILAKGRARPKGR